MKVKVAQLCLTLCDPMDYTVHGIRYSIFQEIFLTQGSNPGFPHCRHLYQLSHQGSPFKPRESPNAILSGHTQDPRGRCS